VAHRRWSSEGEWITTGKQSTRKVEGTNAISRLSRQEERELARVDLYEEEGWWKRRSNAATAEREKGNGLARHRCMQQTCGL